MSVASIKPVESDSIGTNALTLVQVGNYSDAPSKPIVVLPMSVEMGQEVIDEIPVELDNEYIGSIVPRFHLGGGLYLYELIVQSTCDVYVMTIQFT